MRIRYLVGLMPMWILREIDLVTRDEIVASTLITKVVNRMPCCRGTFHQWMHFSSVVQARDPRLNPQSHILAVCREFNSRFSCFTRSLV
jgi:hypothetical protein